jgi:NADPH-dependent 2,4-dienoyl-CoA reductase/sulfur reductase-like enzyme
VSDTYELLAIGGGPAGFSALRAYRDEGAGGSIAIVTDEERMPYNRPPLTKELLRGEADEAELPIEAESWLGEHDASLIAGRAIGLDGERREVTLSGGRVLRYRSCVIATGAEPLRLPIPGADDPAVRTVRSLDQLRELQRRLTEGAAVIVVGSGFIGCEIAASLALRGHSVSLVSDEVTPNGRRLGEQAGAVIAGWLQELGVTTVLGTGVEGITRRDGALELTVADHSLRAAIVVMATGVAPRGELAAACGLELHDGAVPVDAAMRTGRPGVLAAGDVAFAVNAAAGRPLRVEHWGDALGQGAVAGATAAGATAEWNEVPGFWTTIGRRTLKYAAWGDGYDVVSLRKTSDGEGFAAWYGGGGRVVGVLAHEDDESYERGRELIAEAAPWPG